MTQCATWPYLLHSVVPFTGYMVIVWSLAYFVWKLRKWYDR